MSENSATPNFTPNFGLSQILKVSLILNGFYSAKIVYTHFGLLRILSDQSARSSGSDSTLPEIGHRLTELEQLQVISYLIIGILFLIWVYRSHKNLSAMGSQNLRFSHRWSVGWFLIPIMNLWKPYQVMQEIRERSGLFNDSHLRVKAWWIAYTAGFILSVCAGVVVDDSTHLRVGIWGLIFSGILDILAAILAAMVVREITDAQDSSHRARANS